MSDKRVADAGPSTSTVPKLAQATTSQSQVKFIGPGQEEFSDFRAQAIGFLDLHLPKWRTYDAAENYLIPPIFSFLHPDVSDKAMENAAREALENKQQPPSEAGHRLGDEAEYLMYEAIFELLSLIKAPYIAFRGLKMINAKGTHKWKAIFPALNQAEFENALREYDYVLIGPAFGIVVIEVKGCLFDNPDRDFVRGNKRFPKKYSEALDQLYSADNLVKLLETVSGLTIPKYDVCKIIFTPNLEKQRYDDWFRRLDRNGQFQVKKYIGHVIQIGKCTGSQRSNDGSSVADELFCILSDNAQRHVTGSTLTEVLVNILKNQSSFTPQVYEAYAPVLAGISALVMIPSNDIIPAGINLSKTNFSIHDTTMKAHEQVSEQNPSKGRKHRLSSLVKSSESVEKHIKVLFLSPDQQRALNGPNIQLIVAAAGIGKTVILQAKAMELLAKGERVTVVCAECYANCYEELFVENGYTNYAIHHMSDDEVREIQKIIDYAGEDACKKLPYIERCRVVYQHLTSQQNIPGVFQWIHTNSNIIIDDLFDQNRIVGLSQVFWTPYCMAYLAMAFANQRNSENVAWIAFDPTCYYDSDKHKPEASKQNPIDFVRDFCKDSIIRPKLVTLKQVMRCSENIFKASNYGIGLELDSDMTPVIGHKINGCEVTSFPHNISGTKDEAISLLCDIVQRQLGILIMQGFRPDSIAIIVMDSMEKQRLEQVCEESDLPYSDKKQKGVLTIHKWDCVSSLEWPVVIFAMTASSRVDKENYVKYTMYRAMTRATVKLTHIQIVYDKL